MTGAPLLLRLYLLLGLVGHKVLWEALKGPRGARPAAPRSTRLVAIKAVKIGILAGILAQTLLPFDLLPILESPAALRAAGAFLFTLGLLTAVLGRVQLGGNWSDIETARVLDRQEVVSRGIYRLIRHPIYAGDLCLLLGLELALNSWLVLGLAGLVPVVVVKAIREERMLCVKLEGYREYCAMTRRFIPWVA